TAMSGRGAERRPVRRPAAAGGAGGGGRGARLGRFLRLGPSAVSRSALGRRRIGEVARESVTVDLLSGGRLVVGAGLGSLEAEFTAFGESGDARQRAARL